MEIVLKTMKWEKSQGELPCGYLRESHCHYFAVRVVMTEPIQREGSRREMERT